MAWRISKEILHGWVDNTVRGKVTGEIFFEGWNKPMQALELEGNCHRDLAGSRCEFKNPTPLRNKRLDINPEQIGKVGDMTASRRCKVPDIALFDYMEQKEKGLKPPEHLSNVLYLEWFSERNGRVVIELPDAEIDVTLPKWKMTKEEEKEQFQDNFKNMTSFLDKLVEAKMPPRKPNLTEEDMDEFEWELMMKESDAKSEKYGELLEKYIDHPDRDKIINEQMGWDFDESDMLEACLEGFEIEEADPYDIYEQKEHPLVKRIGDLWLSLHEYVDGAPCDQAEEPTGIMVADLIFNIQCAKAKSGSVLDNRDLFENGMIIAKLKRTITYIHEAINLAANKNVVKALPDIIEPIQAELFVIREEMIKLMNKLRKE